MKKCPFCAEEIQDEAIFCKYCHRELVASTATPVPQNKAVSATPGFSVTRVGQEKAGWAPTVSVISIVAGIIGLAVFGIPLGLTAMICGTLAAGAGEGKGKIGIVLGMLDMVAAVCILVMLTNR